MAFSKSNLESYLKNQFFSCCRHGQPSINRVFEYLINNVMQKRFKASNFRFLTISKSDWTIILQRYWCPRILIGLAKDSKLNYYIIERRSKNQTI